MTMLAELRRRDPPLYWTGLASLLGLACAAALMLVDDLSVAGVDVWQKPAKFGASIGLYLWTLAWLRPWLPARPLRWVRPVVVVSMLVELICIFGQSARGVGSHFNDAAALDSVVFALMGLAIVANTVALAVLAVAVWRGPARTVPAIGWGIRIGLAITVLGGLEGALMIGNMGHAVGVPDGGPGLPITAWSTRGGDLRVAHFVALHALQGLPLLGYVLSRGAGDDAAQRQATRRVMVLGGSWFLVCVVTLVIALLGRPILRI